MGTLSHDQFAEQVNAGGSSRLLHDNSEVPFTRGNYAVSDARVEHKVAHPVVREQVVAHQQAMLADPTIHGNPHAMQGGWAEDTPEGKDVYLDSSSLTKGRRAAVAEGNLTGQRAVFSHARAIDDKPNTDVYLRRGYATGKAGPDEKIVGNRSVGYTVEPRRKKT